MLRMIAEARKLKFWSTLLRSKVGIHICARTSARVRRGADEEHADQDPVLRWRIDVLHVFATFARGVKRFN